MVVPAPGCLIRATRRADDHFVEMHEMVVPAPGCLMLASALIPAPGYVRNGREKSARNPRAVESRTT